MTFFDKYYKTGPDGKLITESLKDYTRKTVRKAYTSLNAFLNAWNDAERKQAIIEELSTQGVFLVELAEQVGRGYDAFDLVCHVAFDQPALTRRERAERVRKRNVFGKYGEKARAVLESLLGKYADAGLKSVESLEILKVDPLVAFGTPVALNFVAGVATVSGPNNGVLRLYNVETAALNATDGSIATPSALTINVVHGPLGKFTFALATPQQNGVNFTGPSTLDIGRQNIEAAERLLRGRSIPTAARDVGGCSGRSLIVHVTDGRVVVRTEGNERELTVLAEASRRRQTRASLKVA